MVILVQEKLKLDAYFAYKTALNVSNMRKTI